MSDPRTSSESHDVARLRPRVFGRASLALLAAALVFHFLPMTWPANRFDAGIQLTAAELIRAGRRPYEDFHTLYPPGSARLLAWWFDVVGATFDANTALNSVLTALNAWVAWHVAARAGAGPLRALVAFAAGLAFVYPFPSLVLALVAVSDAGRVTLHGAWRDAAAGGTLVGGAAWFRQDVGAVAAVAVATAAAMAPENARPLRRAALAATSAAAATLTLAVLLLPAVVTAPREVWDGLVLRPAATVAYRDAAGRLGPALRDPAFAMAAAAAVLALAFGGFAARRCWRDGQTARAARLVGLVLVAAWAVRYAALRADSHHIIPAGIVGAIVLAASAPGCGRGAVTAATLAIAVAATALPLFRGAAARAAESLGRRDLPAVSVGDLLPGARTLALRPDEVSAWTQLVRRLRERLGDGEPFFSACLRHDRIHDQDVLLYSAVPRLPPVRDFHFDPGVTTREDVQRRIAADLGRNGVRVVVRFDSRTGPPPAGSPEGSTYLDEWLAARFRREERIGRYEIWVRDG